MIWFDLTSWRVRVQYRYSTVDERWECDASSFDLLFFRFILILLVRILMDDYWWFISSGDKQTSTIASIKGQKQFHCMVPESVIILRTSFIHCEDHHTVYCHNKAYWIHTERCWIETTDDICFLSFPFYRQQQILGGWHMHDEWQITSNWSVRGSMIWWWFWWWHYTPHTIFDGT